MKYDKEFHQLSHTFGLLTDRPFMSFPLSARNKDLNMTHFTSTTISARQPKLVCVAQFGQGNNQRMKAVHVREQGVMLMSKGSPDNTIHSDGLSMAAMVPPPSSGRGRRRRAPPQQPPPPPQQPPLLSLIHI